MNLLQKFKETSLSVLPVMAIVLFLNFTFCPLGNQLLVRFLFGGLLVILGLTIFLIGVDIGITPVGERTGAALVSKRNLPLLLIVSFFIGILITIAEPDVQVFANQLKTASQNVNKWAVIIFIALGIGLFLIFGILRTILSIRIKFVFLVLYSLTFLLAFFCPKELSGAAFDAGGATTGPMTVPFIMSLGLGVAAVRSGGNKEKKSLSSVDSFGLTGIASIGPVFAIVVYGIFLKIFSAKTGSQETVSKAIIESASVLESGQTPSHAFSVFVHLIPQVLKEVSFALLPLIITFILLQIFLLKMPPYKLRKISKGILYSFAGLVIFLLGATGGFMDAGKKLGTSLGNLACVNGGPYIFLIIAVAFIFGAIIVCAEPAVWVLTEQVEEASGGTITRKVMLLAFASGVALSVSLAAVRIIFNFSLWYILIPGYALSLILAFVCPPLFTGIAFDSGGVASGPMTSTFILSFTMGIAQVSSGMNGQVSFASQAFGVIALVAMTPLIAIQILGIVFKIKSSSKKVSVEEKNISASQETNGQNANELENQDSLINTSINKKNEEESK